MQILIAALLAVLPKVCIGILSKFISEKFLQAVIERLIVRGLRIAAKLTVNTVDDEFADMVEARLKEPVP